MLSGEVAGNLLFEVDLEGDITGFVEAIKAASVHHSTVKSLRERQLPSLVAAIRLRGRNSRRRARDRGIRGNP